MLHRNLTVNPDWASSTDTLGKETYKPSPAYHRDWPGHDNPYVTTVYHSYEGPASPTAVPAQPTMRPVPVLLPGGQQGQRVTYISTDA